MKTHSCGRVIGIVAVVFAISVAKQGIAQPPVLDMGDVLLTFEFAPPSPDAYSGTLEGHFGVTGAFRDGGLATETYWLASDPSDFEVILAHGFKVLRGRRGVLVIGFEARLFDGGLWGEAEWWISLGTGAYKKIGAEGVGSVELVFSDSGPLLSAEYTGTATRDPALR